MGIDTLETSFESSDILRFPIGRLFAFKRSSRPVRLRREHGARTRVDRRTAHDDAVSARLRRPLATLLRGIVVVGLSCSGGCARHHASEPFAFTSAGERVAGALVRPHAKDHERPPLLVFVHGDGPLPADAFGYYPPIRERLADDGIASLSWDKKGIGESEGSWLAQSMDDRVREVVDAIDALRVAYPGEFSRIGLIGFSQAGWVVPDVPRRSPHVDFVIVVSGAIDWQRQGEYHTRRRLEAEGASAAEIERAIEEDRAERVFFDGSASYEEWLEHERRQGERSAHARAPALSRERFEFITLNHAANATEALREIDVPVLALFGEDDLNVDPLESSRTYRSLLQPGIDPRHRVVVYPDATHALLKSERFDAQSPGLWSLFKLGWYGADAFVPNALEDIVGFARDAR